MHKTAFRFCDLAFDYRLWSFGVNSKEMNNAIRSGASPVHVHVPKVRTQYSGYPLDESVVASMTLHEYMGRVAMKLTSLAECCQESGREKMRERLVPKTECGDLSILLEYVFSTTAISPQSLHHKFSPTSVLYGLICDSGNEFSMLRTVQLFASTVHVALSPENV